MLKISDLSETGDETTLRLDGNLSGAWVDELRKMCDAAIAQQHTLVVDCGGLQFSDTQGLDLLRGLIAHAVKVTNCSPFLQFQLNQSVNLAK